MQKFGTFTGNGDQPPKDPPKNPIAPPGEPDGE